MTTFAELVEETLLEVEGFSGDQGIFGTLAGEVTNSASSFTVNGPVLPDGSGMSTGMVEIGDELCYVQNLNRATGAMSGVLRGWRGTAPVAHATGSLVRANPLYPRIAVKRSINRTILAVWPRVYGVGSSTFPVSSERPVYDIPNADNILEVTWYDVPTTQSIVCRNYKFSKQRGTIEVWDAQPHTPLTIVYGRRPAELVSNSSQFSTTFLPDFTESLIVTGAALRLIQGVTLSAVPHAAMEQTLLAQTGLQLGQAGGNAVKLYAALYEQRLAEAERQLAATWPAPTYYRW